MAERRPDLSLASLLLSDGYPGEVRRALSDLRHRGGSLEMGRDFPTSGSDGIQMSSHPFASNVKAGERIVVAVSGGSAELTPRPETELLSHYFQAVLPRQFDAYVWFDGTHAVRPLGRGDLMHLPRAHPFR